MRQQVRFVTVKGVRYLRVEDVAAYILELGGGEETDVRNRMKQAASALIAAR